MAAWDVPDGVTKQVIHGGKGDFVPISDGCKTRFHYRTLVISDNDQMQIDDSRKDDGEPFELYIGKQFKLEIWEKLIKTMRIGEVAQFICQPQHVGAYPLVSKSLRDIKRKQRKCDHGHDHNHDCEGETHHTCGFAAFQQGLGYPDLDEFARFPKPVVFQIELLSIEQPGNYEKELWTMSLDEKRSLLPAWKDEGNSFYKAGQYDRAAEKYAQALGCLEQLCTREKPGTDEWNDLEHTKVVFLLNYSQCMMQKKDYYKAIIHLSSLLEKDASNVKGLFRRATAHVAVGDYSAAKEDFQKVVALDSSLKAAVDKELKLIALEEKRKDFLDKEKLIKAFQKLS